MSDFLAAFCVGVNQVLFGHPFDTTMVLIQNKKKWLGLSVKDYYRGWRYPLISSTIFNCTVFPIYERTLPYTNSSILSGFISGVIVSPAVFCFQVGKIRQQTKQKTTLNHFLTSKGRISTLCRESIAMSSYFSVYYYCKDIGYSPLIGGGISGLVNWTITYPIDVIKSRQIAQNISIKKALKMKHLWRGYPICATRAIIVNASNFWVYEAVKNILDDNIV